jgi:DnaJ-class molecular chaperone
LLGVARQAGGGELKRAYYALAKRFHPDRFRREVDEAQRARVEAAFAQIAQAYETLSDDKARAAYDDKRPAAAHTRPAAHEEGRADASTPPVSEPAAAPAPDRQASAEKNFQQGLAALKQENYRTALLCLAESVRLAPKQARYHAHYARALARDPRTRRQAEAELRTALTLDAANAGYHVMLAELYNSVGMPRRADAELRRALALDPDNAAARRLLEEIKAVTSDR